MSKNKFDHIPNDDREKALADYWYQAGRREAAIEITGEIRAQSRVLFAAADEITTTAATTMRSMRKVDDLVELFKPATEARDGDQDVS